MYNVRRKEEYMNKYVKKGQMWAFNILFSKSESYEIKYQMDLCELSEDILYHILQQCSEKYTGLYACISAAYKYIQWCYEYGYTSCNWLDNQFNLEGLVYRIGISDDVFINESTLNTIMSRLDQDQNSTLYKALVLSIYYGLDDGEIKNLASLTANKIINHQMILYNGKRIQIPEHVEELLKKSACLQYEIVDNGKKYELRGDSNQIFKTHWSSQNNNRRFSIWINKISEVCSMNLTPVKLRNSGILLRVSKLSRQYNQDLYEDMCSADVMTKNGYNKELIYNRILNDLSLTMTWNDFCLEFGLWAKFI